MGLACGDAGGPAWEPRRGHHRPGTAQRPGLGTDAPAAPTPVSTWPEGSAVGRHDGGGQGERPPGER